MQADGLLEEGVMHADEEGKVCLKLDQEDMGENVCKQTGKKFLIKVMATPESEMSERWPGRRVLFAINWLPAHHPCNQGLSQQTALPVSATTTPG
jgi:hypothetical protein